MASHKFDDLSVFFVQGLNYLKNNQFGIVDSQVEKLQQNFQGCGISTETQAIVGNYGRLHSGTLDNALGYPQLLSTKDLTINEMYTDYALFIDTTKFNTFESIYKEGEPFYLYDCSLKGFSSTSTTGEGVEIKTLEELKELYPNSVLYTLTNDNKESPLQQYCNLGSLPRTNLYKYNYSLTNDRIGVFIKSLNTVFSIAPPIRSLQDSLKPYFDGFSVGISQPLGMIPEDISFFWYFYNDSILKYRIRHNGKSYFILYLEPFIEYLKYVGYKNITTDLETALNGTFGPTPAPEPEIPTTTPEQTAPGQENNEIINNGGTGDSSSDLIEKETNPTGTAGGLTNSYILNYNEVLKIQGELYKPSFIKSLKALNFNLQDCVLSLMIYPFNIIENSSYSSVSNKTVRLGEYDVIMEYDVYKIAPSSVGKFKVGEISIKPYFGNFLDFSSTAMKIYLPYLGFYEIDPFDVYSNEKLTVYYTVEFETGRVKATIENDSGNIINYYSGQIGIQLSFVGSNFGEIMKNVIFSTITGGLTSNLGGFTAGAEKVLNSEMTHNGGTDGSSIERFMPQKPYLLIMHPDTIIPTNYNKTVGRPSLITITLNKIKGYTEVENPILNIPGATETEINEIVSILKNGFRIQ